MILLPDLFQLQSLKRFSIATSLNYFHWSALRQNSSNVEYLTISGIPCQFHDLQNLSRSAPRLKYLDVRISTESPGFMMNSKKQLKTNVTSMLTLHTLILSFEHNNLITTDILAAFLQSTPVLNRLEIKAHMELIDADRWERLLETSLPLLSHFTLQTTFSDAASIGLHNILATFQTSFWIAKKNYNIIITEYKYFDADRYNEYHRSQFGLPIIRCQTAPDRTVNGGLTKVNEITRFRLLDTNSTVSSQCYFDNIKYLIVDIMNESVLKWMITHMNGSQIKELAITVANKKIDGLSLLLTYVRNMGFASY